MKAGTNGAFIMPADVADENERRYILARAAYDILNRKNNER
jgi:hypothetical protein